ncbi:sn-glycerol-1-phosphate dehydrogenase [Mesorhizobium sp. A623]
MTRKLEADVAAPRTSDRHYDVPAIERSKSIDRLIVGEGCIGEAGVVFRNQFGGSPALILADEITYAVAGIAVREALASTGMQPELHIMPSRPQLSPDRRYGEAIATLVKEMGSRSNGIRPVLVAVGSGVINDLARYAAYTAGTSFMSVPTAASMDGYTSAGAPLSDNGFKITIQCAPPRVILADLDIISAAPPAMSGWGFGDLSGKVPAGGDWLIADALGIEALDDTAWPLVQDNLRGWLSNPAGVQRGDKAAIAELFVGLAASGVAMELHGSSRPASGADHQIAHLWEMEGLSLGGQKVAHGACVAIGCLTMLALFDWLIQQDFSRIDPLVVAARSPQWAAVETTIGEAFDNPAIMRRSLDETRAKWVAPEDLAARLANFRTVWPSLRQRLSEHLIRGSEMRALLVAAGAPATTRQIGLTPKRHRATVLKARWIRKRYTLLDLLDEAGMLDRAVAQTFHAGNQLYA